MNQKAEKTIETIKRAIIAALENKKARHKFLRIEEEKPSPNKIYVCNFQGQDFSAARKFSTLPGEDIFIYITKGKINNITSKRLRSQIEDKIQDSAPEDFLILSGRKYLQGTIMEIWLNKHEKVRYLIYDHKSKKYKVGVLDPAAFKKFVK